MSVQQPPNWRVPGLDATGRKRQVVITVDGGRAALHVPAGEVISWDIREITHAIEVLAEARDELRARQ